MRPLGDESECCCGNFREEGEIITSTRCYLPTEILQRIVELLPLDRIFLLAISTKAVNFLSIFAWGLCLQRLDFVELSDQDQLSVLRKLYTQRQDRLETLKSLLRLMEEPLEEKFRRILLEEAIRRNDEDLTVLSLLHAGTEADLAVGLGFAIKHRQSNMVEFFLAKKAEIDADSIAGVPRSSLQIACDHGDMPLINRLLTYDYHKRTMLHVAASFGCYDIVENLHKSPALARLSQVKNRHGHLPMQCAVIAADVQMVRLLAFLGSSIHIQDEEGYNLLHLAVTRCMQSSQRKEAYQILITWLIAEGCDQTALNKYGETPLECAKSQKSPQEVIDLLEMHAIESMHIDADEIVNLGQDHDHPIIIADNEEEGHASRHSQELTNRDNLIPAPSPDAAGLGFAGVLTGEGVTYQPTNANTSTKRVHFKTRNLYSAEGPRLRRSQRITALFEGAVDHQQYVVR